MPPIKSIWVLFGLAMAWVLCFAPDTFGQAAFTPNIGAAPTGQTLTVTPVVTPDRRYVRLSVNPFFNAVNGFTAFTTPLGAVSGSGGNALGGGGLGGGLGGVGGLRSVSGLDGVTFNAGMNGVIGPAGFEGSIGVAPMGFAGQVGEMRAGALPYDGGFGYGLYPGLAPGWVGWNDARFRPDQSRPAAFASPSDAKHQHGGASAIKTVPSVPHADRKSVSRRQKAQAAQIAKAKKVSEEEPIVKPKAPRRPDQSE